MTPTPTPGARNGAPYDALTEMHLAHTRSARIRNRHGVMMTYEGSAKHKEPWQPGRRGTLCPRDISKDLAQNLLNTSLPDPNPGSSKRYAVLEGRAFCGNRTVDDVYHGWPVGFQEVPPPVWRRWIAQGLVDRREVHKNWKIG